MTKEEAIKLVQKDGSLLEQFSIELKADKEVVLAAVSQNGKSVIFASDELKNDKRVILYTSTNAYDELFFKTQFLDKKIKFDFMLDDGPHTLESMKEFIKLYSQVMTDDGILIIEDVQEWDWIEILKNEVPKHLKKFVKTYDLRPNKNRYDDIIFTIDKSNK
jgi:hypothetical protein